MSPEDDRQLRSLVRQAVNASSLGVRQLERAMGLGSGYLERLLDGRLEIKVRHLVDLARLLRVPPSHFLHFGCPDANRSAVSGLAKVLGLKEQPDPFLTSRTTVTASSTALSGPLTAAGGVVGRGRPGGSGISLEGGGGRLAGATLRSTAERSSDCSRNCRGSARSPPAPPSLNRCCAYWRISVARPDQRLPDSS